MEIDFQTPIQKTKNSINIFFYQKAPLIYHISLIHCNYNFNLSIHTFQIQIKIKSRTYFFVCHSIQSQMDKLFEKVIELANARHIHVVVREYGAGAVACTALSFAGGLLGGPVGLAVGGFLGGLAAYGISSWANRNQFFLFFLNLTQKQLRQSIQLIINSY